MANVKFFSLLKIHIPDFRVYSGSRSVASCKRQPPNINMKGSQESVTCAGTNTQHFIDLLETMFGDMDLKDIDITKLETEATKELCQQAAKAEEDSVSVHSSIPKDKVTQVLITSIPIPNEFGIPAKSLPETENVKERSAKNPAKKVTRFYYACHVCGHSAQNKPSMMTHTCKCLNIKLMCAACSKEYDSADYAEKHVTDIHGGQCSSTAPKESDITMTTE